jgi:hypothetical protein
VHLLRGLVPTAAVRPHASLLIVVVTVAPGAVNPQITASCGARCSTMCEPRVAERNDSFSSSWLRPGISHRSEPPFTGFVMGRWSATEVFMKQHGAPALQAWYVTAESGSNSAPPHFGFAQHLRMHVHADGESVNGVCVRARARACDSPCVCVRARVCV